jgi:hypothetical protein
MSSSFSETSSSPTTRSKSVGAAASAEEAAVHTVEEDRP